MVAHSFQNGGGASFLLTLVISPHYCEFIICLILVLELRRSFLENISWHSNLEVLI